MYKDINTYTSQGIPFLFYTDFKGEKIHAYPLRELSSEDIEYSFNSSSTSQATPLEKLPEPLPHYQKQFQQVINKIRSGDTYLLNLTQKTKIKTPLTLKEIFSKAHAPFKLRVRDEFVCFSPEPFIKIEGNTISTYPMKGTIDASIKNAEAKILADQKELAEHIMIVDLLRNDLGIVAKNIHVEKFRYVNKIRAGEKELLQVSSKISGTLPRNWRENFGTILKKLLPAGSISGTPKKSMVHLIESIEDYTRNYFSGI
ncbi:MAG TPA: aminodeoxychorismate synthase component I, partial [Pyrodictium sp.]|nr:aminodeoxychorismate synthase component I [Pyrodictium sp.]